MNYNDFITLNDRDYNIMKQNYDRILENETQDLEEILVKMKNHREELMKQNADSRYDDILTKLDNNISDLSSIILNNNSNLLYKSKSPEIPQMKGIFRDKAISQQTDPSGAISPTRSKDEINSHNSMNQRPNNPMPSPEDTDRRPSPALPNDNIPTQKNRPNALKRNSPMPGNFISNIIKQFSLNPLKTKKVMSVDTHRNRFHNIISLHHKCDHRDQLIGSQIDIIRLLLLYIALRPNCKYISRIATIANEQFDNLLRLETF